MSVNLKAFTTPQLTLLKTCNEIIAQMVNYGVNHTIAKKDGFIAMWSNGCKDWGIFGQMTKIGDAISLDANMFLIPSTDNDLIKSILALFSPLPLYFYSTEAKMRSEAPTNVNAIVSELRTRAKAKNENWGEVKLVEF